RSMMTILGGYIAGMNAKDSAKFSFLLGLITLSAASAYKIYTDGNAMFEALSLSPLLLGLVVAFFSSIIAVRWLVEFLTKYGLIPFAVYRIILAVILITMIYTGIL
ncbi:MAG: undecaprenyl-diphosphate phosphatase, partial [Opitutales bacterium]|nr:undecaprenyl-diphosphate phosphatase [Opitutales bacterium]